MMLRPAVFLLVAFVSTQCFVGQRVEVAIRGGGSQDFLDDSLTMRFANVDQGSSASVSNSGFARLQDGLIDTSEIVPRNQSNNATAQVRNNNSFSSFIRLTASASNDAINNASGVAANASAGAIWRDELFFRGENNSTPTLTVRYRVDGNLLVDPIVDNVFDLSAAFFATENLNNTSPLLQQFGGAFNRAHSFNSGRSLPLRPGAFLEHEAFELTDSRQRWIDRAISDLQISGDSFSGIVTQDINYDSALGYYPLESVFMVSVSATNRGAASANLGNSISLIGVLDNQGNSITNGLTFGSGRTIAIPEPHSANLLLMLAGNLWAAFRQRSQKVIGSPA